MWFKWGLGPGLSNLGHTNNVGGLYVTCGVVQYILTAHSAPFQSGLTKTPFSIDYSQWPLKMGSDIAQRRGSLATGAGKIVCYWRAVSATKRLHPSFKYLHHSFGGLWSGLHCCKN